VEKPLLCPAAALCTGLLGSNSLEPVRPAITALDLRDLIATSQTLGYAMKAPDPAKAIWHE
jgi:hypothetical protein